MSWSIAEVARMSGVTSRTLRHYDDIGLLKPASIGVNGYRYYGEDELLRLQQILVLRELGIGLREIGEIVDSEGDTIAALRRQLDRLRGERDRLERLANTVSRTIAELTSREEGDSTMGKIKEPENLFEGFDHTQYEQEAKQRWGAEAVEASNRKWEAMTPEQRQQTQVDLSNGMRRMAELFAASAAVDSPEVLDAVDGHYRWICNYWTPNAEAYVCLGQMYVDDPRFAANYENLAEGLSLYMRDAMAAYAAARLS